MRTDRRPAGLVEYGIVKGEPGLAENFYILKFDAGEIGRAHV